MGVDAVSPKACMRVHIGTQTSDPCKKNKKKIGKKKKEK